MIKPGLHPKPPRRDDWDIARWPHFTALELSCTCQRHNGAERFCEGEYFHNDDFLDFLEELRVQAGKPLVINSGHRCARRNIVVGGAPRSHHRTIAADISLTGHDRHALRAAAVALSFHGIGLGVNFLHVDRRARPATWDYGEDSRKAWGLV